jgi:hypothetical protein
MFYKGTNRVRPGSVVRFEKLLQIFGLLQRVRKPATIKFGIGSVSVAGGDTAEKIRYLSSSY